MSCEPPIPHLSPAVIREHCPELSVLEVLDAALGSTIKALSAANPELRATDTFGELADSSLVKTCLADVLLTQLYAVESALERYRSHVVHDAQRRAACVEPHPGPRS